MIMYKILRFVSYSMHRIPFYISNLHFSLTFPYAIVLMLLQVSMKHFEDFGIIDVPSVDHLTCPENMWRNIFFIDTFFPLEERVTHF